MRQRRETAEHPFGTMEGENRGDALSNEAPAGGSYRDGPAVLAYNLTRVMNIMGIRSLIVAMGVLP